MCEIERTPSACIDAPKSERPPKQAAQTAEKTEPCLTKDPEAKTKPPKIGNFALPTSQQPAALFGFGGNIIDASEVQFYFFADDLAGKRRRISDLIPSVLFGVTDNFSVLFSAPVTPSFRDGKRHASGLEDFFIQLEYAFYGKSTEMYSDQATLVGNITFPTGSIRKNPPTGFGAATLFLGGTFYRTWVDWFAFTSNGGILTQSDNGSKFGEIFLYQMGFGKNYPSPPGWIYAWMVEVDGQYAKKNRINCQLDHNSGGNVIFITPSIWASSKDFLLQFGVSLPVYQNLFGKQNKFDYGLNLNCAWSFY